MKRKSDKPLLPVPTHWIRRVPDGDPPGETLLLMQAYDGEHENPIVELGYWSSKLNQFLSLESQAIEENFKVHSYHIVHDEDGEPYAI